ncbi:uncharacterized protein [Haliotis asinina]|uniref:uncharacterized protein n=1 Tax=Haliotis asinina TaxID=109174 RepID=UPI0035324239
MDKEKGSTFRVVFSENQQGLPLTNQQQQPYHLVIDIDAVRLRDVKSNDLILEWPYDCVRRYGMSPSKFSLEVGRKSATGEGLFEMETKESQAIMDKIHEVSKHIILKRGWKKPTNPKIDNVYTEPYTQLPMRPRDTVYKGDVSDEKCKEARPTHTNTVAPCFVTGDGVTIIRIGQGSKPEESHRLEPPVPPGLEPPVPPRLEPPVPPRLEPPVPPRLEPPVPPRLEPPVPPIFEPPVPPRLEPRVPSRLEPPLPPRLEHRVPSKLEPPLPPRLEPPEQTGSKPRAPTGSETDVYLLPTVEDSVSVNKDDRGVALHVGTLATSQPRSDEEQGTYWTSTSNEPPIHHDYERLTIRDDDSRRQVDTKSAPGKTVVFDLPQRECPKQPRGCYENVKLLKR